jgi:S1-C subfamily serine protease
VRFSLRHFFGLAIVACLASCGKPSSHLQSQQAEAALNDSLSRYSIEELRQALDTRRNQTVHPHTGDALDVVSDRDLVNGLIRREKMVYPHEIRKDYYEFQENTDYQRDAQSVAAFIKPDHYHLTNDGLTLSYKPLGEAETLCSDQSFFSQPSAAFCSGFVVGPNLIATAGHCVTSDWKSVRIVFGYRMVRDASGVHLGMIRSNDVYKIQNVLSQQVDGEGKDFAVLQTDRPIDPEHPPMPRRDQGQIEVHEGVYTLGYPTGLPLKLADQASVGAISTKGFFQADLDTYGGNSGSPVLNASSHVVEGILVRGANDYRYIREDKCYKALACPTVNGCEGEDVTLISALNDASTGTGIAITQPTASQVEKSLALTKREPITRQFSSGSVVSGSRKSFSGEYLVTSDPAPDGYRIGKFSYSLAGDRVCNAWSTCSARIEDGKVVFRFTLQGHDEWGGAGQAYSTGTLVVTYDPL